MEMFKEVKAVRFEGKPSEVIETIVNDEDIKAFLTRPQSSPVELNRGMVDLAIVGEDWVKEESVLIEIISLLK